MPVRVLSSRAINLRLLAVAGATSLIAFLAWVGQPASSPAADCAGSNEASVLCRMLQGTSLPPGVDASDIGQLRAFYDARSYQPAWTGNENSVDAGRHAADVLAAAEDEGLAESDYRIDADEPRDERELAVRDIQITERVLHYVRDVRIGRVTPDSLDTAIELPTQAFDPVPELLAALRDGAVGKYLDAQRPQHADYTDLESILKTYRALAASGSWHALAAAPKNWEEQPGYVIALVDRLSLEDADASGLREVTDSRVRHDALALALSRFQQRNGLKTDGKLGRATLAALNIPPSERIEQIQANMERWRWMPRHFESRYILVNVPQNALKVVQNGATVLVSRVVVGRPTDPSPMLRATVRGLLVNPPWNVPRKIAQREILPKLKRNRRYLAQENMILKNGPARDPHGLSINWRALGRIPYDIQQLPGPKAALGFVKLDMPNRFDVYLHDTPTRSAFDLDVRNLSHGCIRVQQIQQLASFVVAGDTEAGLQTVQAAIDSGVTQRIAAAQPLAVYLGYWTVFRDENGIVNFRPDIYGRDRQLIDALHGLRSTRVTAAAIACCVG